MTMGYEEGIIIISLAMFGLYAIIEEIGKIAHCSMTQMPTTILLVVQNAEERIERLVRCVQEEYSDHAMTDMVIADVASTDQTRMILARLAEENDSLRILHSDTKQQGIKDGISVARGEVIHLCDLIHRLDADTCIDYLGRLAETK